MKFKTFLVVEKENETKEAQTIEGVDIMPRGIVVFQFMYMRFGAQMRSYFSSIRPLICLDGCFQKTLTGGHLLCVIARDGNENMLPLAIACVDLEYKES